MNSLSNNSFQIFCNLSQRVQKIQREVEEDSVTPEKRIALHRELERLQNGVEDLQSLAAQTQGSVLKQFSQLDGQIVSLYRFIEERFEAYEVSVISRQAMDLTVSLGKNATWTIAKKIDSLKHNIHFLFQHRRPSLKNRQIISLVMKISDHVGEALSKMGETLKEHLQLIQLLQSLLKEALNRSETFISVEESELAMELYEIADLFEHRRENKARLKLNLIRSLLTPSQQRRIDAAENSSKELVHILLEIASGDPSTLRLNASPAP